MPARVIAAFYLAWLAAPAPSQTDWKLAWSDEFNGATLDRGKWDFDIGGGGWGNNELEYYTDRTENARVENGSLIVEARREDFGNRGYTSARLVTRGKFSRAYGRFEARIQAPYGQGIWPAFWMLGDDIAKVGWPRCGEIDIMEIIGKEPRNLHGTIHGPGYSGGSGIGGKYTLGQGEFKDDFHVFAVEWEPNVIRWYVDQKLYQTRTPADLPAGARWVFDKPFHILINVAVGGNWPGNPDASTQFPQRLRVDYVRVYERPGPAPGSGGR